MATDDTPLANKMALPGDASQKPTIDEKGQCNDLPFKPLMDISSDNQAGRSAAPVRGPRVGDIPKTEPTSKSSIVNPFCAGQDVPDLRKTLDSNSYSINNRAIEDGRLRRPPPKNPRAAKSMKTPITILSRATTSPGVSVEDADRPSEAEGHYQPFFSPFPQSVSGQPPTTSTSSATETVTALPKATPMNNWPTLKAHILARDHAGKSTHFFQHGGCNSVGVTELDPPMRPACDLCKTSPLAIPSLPPHSGIANPKLLNFQPGEEVAVVLPCGHMFGNDCLVKHFAAFAHPRLRECPACGFAIAFGQQQRANTGGCDHPLRGVAISPFSLDPFGKVPPVKGEAGFFVPETCTACRARRLAKMLGGRIRSSILRKEVRGGEAETGKDEWLVDEFSGSDSSALVRCRDQWIDKAEEAVQNVLLAEKTLEGIRPTWGGQWP